MQSCCLCGLFHLSTSFGVINFQENQYFHSCAQCFVCFIIQSDNGDAILFYILHQILKLSILDTNFNMLLTKMAAISKGKYFENPWQF